MMNSPEYRRICDKWNRYAKSYWWGDYIDVRFYLTSVLKNIHNKKIIELGCGAGIILSELDDTNDIYGIDISLEAITIARRLNPNGHFIVADLHELPFKKEQFEVVVLSSILYLFKDRKKVLYQVNNFLKKNGDVYFATSNAEYSYYLGHPMLLNYEELENCMSVFSQVNIKPYNPIPPLLFFLPSRIRRKINKKYYLLPPSFILAKIPGIFSFLEFFMNKGFLKKKSRGFFATAKKSSSVTLNL